MSMRRFAVLVCLFLLIGLSYARQLTRLELREKQREAIKRLTSSRPRLEGRAANGSKNITFNNPRASEFYVDGTTIPEVNFDIGPSWAGLLPISGDANETRKLFFWFFPPGPQGSLDDLIFWTNGGPGCSSLIGLLQENGPFSWAPGQAKPTVNEYSWTGLSSILFVEQPVGTGFSQGTPNIQNEDDLASQLVGFLQQFLEVFSELKGKKLYLTGESYAGMYVPYTANFIYNNPGKLNLDLKGFLLIDPFFSFDIIQIEMPAVNFVHKYENVFALNQSFLAHLDAQALACNYTNYLSDFVTFPPKGPLPLPGNSEMPASGCDLWLEIAQAAFLVNPAFNVYQVFDTYPIPWDVLTDPPEYFDREDVKRAIHAPPNVTWAECSLINVFPNGDNSDLPAINGVLANVIEKSERAVIVHGLADFRIIAEGTRAVIQKFRSPLDSMTWNCAQGFQTAIENDSFIVEGIGALGTAHSERGLTYYEVALSGHMVPQYSPAAAFQTMQFLMGFKDKP